MKERTRRPIIQCQNCNGKGHVPLSTTLFETLEAVRNLKETCAVELSQAWMGKVKPIAFNARLEDLRALALVTRERRGKQFYYQSVK